MKRGTTVRKSRTSAEEGKVEYGFGSKVTGRTKLARH